MTSSNSLTPIPGATNNNASSTTSSIPPSHQQQRGAPNYFECFPDEKLIPSVTLDYLRGSRAAYNICVKLTRVLKVPWMILVTSMAYWHRFFFAHHQMQYKRNNNNNHTSSTLDNNNNKDGRRSRSQTPSLAGKHNNTVNNNLSSSLKTSASEQNLAGLVFENDAIDTEDEDEILAQEKTFEKYHPVLVAVSAFFLALKTECIHRALKTIVTHAFEISSSNDQYPIRREQIIRLELMLMHTLNFHVFQELPWTRALELLPQPQQQQQVENDASGSNQNIINNNNSSKAMLSLFQKVLGYLVQFPFQACYSASAIAECAVWFVADSLEVPQKDEIEMKFNATTENIRQRFANHIIDHIAYNNRPEGREIPKLAAKITALKTRMRMQYGTTGGGSSTGNGNSSSVIGGQNPQSGYSSHHYHPTNNQNITNRNSSMLVGNQSLQISPVPATTTTTSTTNNNPNDNMNNNVGVNYNNNLSNTSNVGGMSSRIRPRDEQQALPSSYSNSAHMNNNNNTRMPQLSVRRPPPQK